MNNTRATRDDGLESLLRQSTFGLIADILLLTSAGSVTLLLVAGVAVVLRHLYVEWRIRERDARTREP